MYLANELLKVAIEEVRALGISVPETIEPNVTMIKGFSRWGTCKRIGDRYIISLNESLLESGDRKSIMQTLVHEVLHTCKCCMNHGRLWKLYATRVNEKYGYNVSRTTSASSLGVEVVKAKYIVQCNGCGKNVLRQRMSRVVSNPEEYRCKCGGTLSRVK